MRKAIDEAIASIDGIAAGAGASADPRVSAFKNQTGALRPDDSRPCGEEASKSNIDKYIQKFEDGQAPLEKWVEDTKNIPLCNGQKAEDDLAAQAYASTLILRYAFDSDIPGKIRGCKVAATGRPPAAPAAVTPPRPGRVMNAFGIYPREITLAPGELKEFQAYVVWSDGTTEDISTQATVRWPKGRQFRSAKEGTYYLTVKAKLDQEREDTATIRVKAPLVIRGPAAAKVGEEVAAQAELSSAKAGVKYRYSWSLDGQALAGNEASQRFRLPREGNNTLRAAAWRWAGNKWDQAAEASLVIYGQAAAPVQVSIVGPDRVTVQDSPVNASFEARLSPESPREQYFYRWGATGPGGPRTFNSQTRLQTIAARTPGTYEIQVNVWKYVNNTWLYVGKASRPFAIFQGTGTGRSYTSNRPWNDNDPPCEKKSPPPCGDLHLREMPL